jgi:hypothetical protein
MSMQTYANLIGQTTAQTRKRLYVFTEDEKEIDKWLNAFQTILGTTIDPKPKNIMAALKVVFALAAIASEKNTPAAEVKKKVEQLFG